MKPWEMASDVLKGLRIEHRVCPLPPVCSVTLSAGRCIDVHQHKHPYFRPYPTAEMNSIGPAFPHAGLGGTWGLAPCGAYSSLRSQLVGF
jgi:hypothetical protein